MRILSPLLIITLALASCSQDPELVRKRDEQRAEIAKLEAELEALEDKLDNAPPDRSAELKALQQKAAQDQESITELEKELADLSAKRRELEKEFAAYKLKYPLR